MAQNADASADAGRVRDGGGLLALADAEDELKAFGGDSGVKGGAIATAGAALFVRELTGPAERTVSAELRLNTCLRAPRDRGHGFRGIVIACSTPS